MNVCAWCCVMDYCEIQGVFFPVRLVTVNYKYELSLSHTYRVEIILELSYSLCKIMQEQKSLSLTLSSTQLKVLIPSLLVETNTLHCGSVINLTPQQY